MLFRSACSPTRGTLISGLYGHNTGVTNVGDTLPASTTSIFELIAGSSPADYAMGVFGKWHIGPNVDHVVNGTGVPVYRGIISGGVSNYYNWTVYSSDSGPTQTTTYSTTAITDYAIEFIENHESSAQADEPWFVYVPYNAPHGTSAMDGFQVPPANLFSSDVGGLPSGPTIYNGNVRVYQAVIQALDTEIGRLLDAIGPVGTPERDNTVVIFMGDNGTPGPIQDDNVGNRGSKASVWQGGVHVPLVIAGAGVTRQSDRETDIVVSSDLYATIAELSGIPVSQIYDSYSLVPLLTDDSASTGRTHGFTEICGFGGNNYAVRDERYKLLYQSTDGGFGLYDLQSDPLEQTDLYDNPSYAAIRTALEAQIQALKASAQTNEGCFQ